MDLKMALLILALMVQCHVSGQVTFDWVQRSSLPSAGRWGAFTFEIGGYGYVAGGDDGNSFRSDVWRYDPVNDSWQQMASMPAGRRHGTSWNMNGKGYVTCGQVALTTYSNMLWEYDPVSNSWAVKAPMPGTPRYGSHGFGVNGQGYVGGGNYGSASGPYLADMWKYDPAMNAWSSTTAIPGLARYGSTSFVVGNKGYVHGGKDASLAFTNELWEFDPGTQSWTMKPSMPGPGRSWTMVMPFAVDAVVTCGAENGIIFNDAYRYVPTSDQWSPIADYPGVSGWSGASFALVGRTFGGLGRTLTPSSTYHSDWWELVKLDLTAVQEVQGGPGQYELEIFPRTVLSGGTVTVFHPGSRPGTRLELIFRSITGEIIDRRVHMNGAEMSVEGISAGMILIQAVQGKSNLSAGRFVVQ